MQALTREPRCGRVPASKLKPEYYLPVSWSSRIQGVDVAEAAAQTSRIGGGGRGGIAGGRSCQDSSIERVEEFAAETERDSFPDTETPADTELLVRMPLLPVVVIVSG